MIVMRPLLSQELPSLSFDIEWGLIIAQALKEYRRNRWHKLVSLFETLAVEE